MSTASSPRAQSEIVVPDCCNIGITFRVLLTVNGVLLVSTLMQSISLRSGALAFIESSMIIELSSLWSLFAVCLLRRLLDRLQPGTVPIWLQRSLCGVLPAAVSAAIASGFAASELFRSGAGGIAPWKAAFMGALLGFLLQHYFELRARAFSPALVAARLQALQARIRPHFLFNSLNAVLSLIRSEPRRAETTLEDLAELFRVLMRDPRQLSTLEEELRLCRQYLAIESIRLGERLQVDWEYQQTDEEQLRHARIPALLLQPLIENAVRYGVEPLPQPQPVRIRLGRILDRIEIAVTNAFRPELMPAPGNHMALENIRERLMLLYDVEAQLTTAVGEGSYEVRLRFPFRTDQG